MSRGGDAGRMQRRTPERPRLKPHVALVPVGPESVLLKGPGLFVHYGGEGIDGLLRLLPLVDGTRDSATLARESGLPEQDVRDALEALVQDGALEDADDDAALPLDVEARARLAPQLGILSHLTSHPARAQARLAEARVLVLGAGALGAAVADALVAGGVGIVGLADEAPVQPHDRMAAAHARATEGETRAASLARWLGQRPGARVERVLLSSPDSRRLFADELRRVARGWTHVVVASDMLMPWLFLQANEACLAERVTWTGAFLDELEASVGPTVIPGQSACWRCYDLRTKGAHPNLERLLAFEAHRQDARAPPLGFSTFATLAGAWTAQAVLTHVSRAALPPLVGEVLRLRFLDLHAQKHRVLRMPRCPACTPTSIPDVDRYALDPVTLS